MTDQSKINRCDGIIPQQLALRGFNFLIDRRFDEVCKIITYLVNDRVHYTKPNTHESDVWVVYTGILAHCLLCWFPEARETVKDVDRDAARLFSGFVDDDQEEFFVFSQRLEDSRNNLVAGLGMYIHYLLLKATGDFTMRGPLLMMLKD